MSKQRALEMCGRAVQRCDEHSLESAILYAVDAIRELAKDEPDVRLNLSTYFKNQKPEWAMSYCEAMADDVIRIVNSGRPISDPP